VSKSLNLNQLENISTEVLQLLTTEQAWHYEVIPFQAQDGMVHCYSNTKNLDAKALELEVLLGKEIELETIDNTVLYQHLGKLYRKNTAEKRQRSTNKSIDLSNTKDFVPNLIGEAKALGSSDIHIEPYEEKARIRMRIDGALMERYVLSKDGYPSLVNKIKIQANLDISEKRLPQDGRIFFEQQGKRIDIRVSILPTLHGEKVVLRLLSNDATAIDLSVLGFNKEDLENYLQGAKKPNGIVLISGPTGSGKTTTLYATLKLLNETSRNILTIEDPIEYTLEGINQVQLKESIGLDFASALRTFLRQDPDVIMVGEVRDKATATMAIRASLTGHLVLTTIHTNRAWGIIARLIDMGVAPFLLADTLNLAVAQRLVRLLCPHCKEEEALNSSEYPKSYKPPKTLLQQYTAKGCSECFYTGYRGRKAIYEVIPIDNELSHCIKNEELNVEHLLKKRNIRSLADNAFDFFEKGLTSLEEVYPILASS
jgi:general secretion pathway protein E/type IV pilus assembly protein PilB